jgi:uncharacterized membrane protein YuzA (DUF378 family)
MPKPIPPNEKEGVAALGLHGFFLIYHMSSSGSIKSQKTYIYFGLKKVCFFLIMTRFVFDAEHAKNPIRFCTWIKK